MAVAADDQDRRQGGSRPIPDPTVLTDAAIAKEALARREAHESLQKLIDAQFAIRDERLSGIDRATTLRMETIDDIPGMVIKEVGHLEILQDEKFDSVQTQFKERDIRAEREARDNKVAVDAAFAAQKEAAAKQDEANQKAIDKSEVATAEKITKLEQLFTASNQGLADKIDDVKERVARIESVAVGGIQQRTEQAVHSTDLRGWIAAGIGVSGFVVLLIDRLAR